ncbi:hypothetical protein K3495_g6350 [Podosphaera aphanis]|nr:hypothetical protein K3495_g6350 [Podosphaera aphanis]
MLDLMPMWFGAATKLLNGPKITEENAEASIIIKKVLHIYGKLAAMRELKPCLEVDDLFSELVQICTKTIDDKITNMVLENPRILNILVELRQLCSRGECQMEEFWNNKVLGELDSTPSEVKERMLAFPYFSNYVDLTRMEISAMSSAEEKPIKKVAFIGSGPLPLTSLCMTGLFSSNLSDIKVLNVDNNPKAIEDSRNLCNRLGSRGEMEFLCAEANSSLDLYDYDAVYLAALVGSTQKQKEALLEQVAKRMRPGALLLTRSAERLRRLMYADFDPTTEQVAKVMDIVLVVHPYNHVVNSVIIGRIKRQNPFLSAE